MHHAFSDPPLHRCALPPYPPPCPAADGSGRVDREEFTHLLDALHAQGGKPSFSMRKSVHSSE